MEIDNSMGIVRDDATSPVLLRLLRLRSCCTDLAPVYVSERSGVACLAWYNGTSGRLREDVPDSMGVRVGHARSWCVRLREATPKQGDGNKKAGQERRTKAWCADRSIVSSALNGL